MAAGRLAAMAAARAAGLPAPAFVARGSLPDGQALLLEWLPGVSLFEVLARKPGDAEEWGSVMGEAQRRLHAVTAPDAVIRVDAPGVHPFDAGCGLEGLPAGIALLHLDWHPLNLLVDEDGGTLVGIVDWDNARRGHPLLDVARTESMLTIEPALTDLPDALRDGLPALRRGWMAGYGPGAPTIDATARRWAARVMLTDLAPRYADDPSRLDEVRRKAGLSAAERGGDKPD
jgi:Ser/Thr protein kinase RdoA (MazF antagonist)